MNKLLLENSARKFFIEWGGFRSNHMSHGIVALHMLGASQEYLERFARRYQNTLVPAQRHGEEFRSSSDLQSAMTLKALLGRRGKYYVVLDHYEAMLKDKYGGDYEEMIKGEFPGLSLGMVGSALHGLIHTGYGLVAKSAQCVCEGMAYLHQSYLPLVLSTTAPPSETVGQGMLDILDVLTKVKEDEALSQRMFEDMQREDAICKTRGRFQPRVGALLHYQGDELAKYVHQIRFPAFFDPACKSLEQLNDLLKWIVDCTITVYLAAERRNDFFLIHGVTSSWSLRQILLMTGDYQVGIEAVRTYLCMLLAVYTAQEKPGLCLQYLQDERADKLSWSDLVEKTLSDEDRDEHIYKLVQVCRDMDKGDTCTEMTGIYKSAALLAITQELAFL